MAIIVEYHVIADRYNVGTTAITAGMLVRLNTAGDIVPAPASSANTTILGVAGDSSLDQAGRTTAYSSAVVMSGAGNTRWTENRVSDFYDETTSSDKITVYHGGGKFWISLDLFDSTPAINALVGISAGNDGEWLITATAGQEQGIAVGASQGYPSGVPGTDVQNSITLGDYVPIVLRI